MAEKNETKIEREYIIPLRRRWMLVPKYQRAGKAVKAVKEFLARHMKIRDRDLDKIRVDKYVNEAIWHRGIKNPPSKIKVRAIREGDIVRVEAVELPKNMKFKKTREEKIESAAKETAKKKKTEKVEEAKVEENKEETKESEQKIEEEKKEAVVEVGKEMEKAMAKKEKHTTKVQTPKQEKNQRVGYNQSSRGH
ncbi:50S ribosomal protein L31e [Candidatus Pacearchaeota archaeon]|nr:50S ribosomal protein L31e [Candidatus Pacearchaeota archaeon]